MERKFNWRHQSRSVNWPQTAAISGPAYNIAEEFLWLVSKWTCMRLFLFCEKWNLWGLMRSLTISSVFFTVPSTWLLLHHLYWTDRDSSQLGHRPSSLRSSSSWCIVHRASHFGEQQSVLRPSSSGTGKKAFSGRPKIVEGVEFQRKWKAGPVVQSYEWESPER